jgi:glycosyltransferase involved in cell wall biosynthesis
MNNIKLSIIIPFYNVEKYIAQCLGSVYNQDIPETDYEVICVNDCSPDNSREIVLDFQRTHKNLKIIEHEKNKMIGGARNTGVLAASGKYLWFVDSDDQIAENCLEKLVKTAEENSLEVLAFNTIVISGKSKFTHWWYFPVETNVITGAEYINNKNAPLNKINVNVWSKIYKRLFLLENKLFFDEGRYYEDHNFFWRCILCCEKFKYLPDCFYYYTVRPDSIMTSSRNRGVKFAHSMFSSLACLEIFDKNSEKLGEISSAIKDFYVETHVIQTIRQVVLLPLKDVCVFVSTLREIDTRKLSKYLSSWKFAFLLKYPIAILFVSFINKLFHLSGKQQIT